MLPKTKGHNRTMALPRGGHHSRIHTSRARWHRQLHGACGGVKSAGKPTAPEGGLVYICPDPPFTVAPLPCASAGSWPWVRNFPRQVPNQQPVGEAKRWANPLLTRPAQGQAGASALDVGARMLPQSEACQRDGVMSAHCSQMLSRCCGRWYCWRAVRDAACRGLPQMCTTWRAPCSTVLCRTRHAAARGGCTCRSRGCRERSLGPDTENLPARPRSTISVIRPEPCILEVQVLGFRVKP